MSHSSRARGSARAGIQGLVAATVLGLTLAEGSAAASPYPLAEIMKKEMAEKLAKHDVTTSDQLLERAARAKQRRQLAKKAGIPARRLFRWVKMCDLLRIKGVGPEMVRLLEAGRVTTVRQLKGRKARRLHGRLMKANKKARVTDNPPDVKQVAAWIEQARKLPAKLR